MIANYTIFRRVCKHKNRSFRKNAEGGRPRRGRATEPPPWEAGGKYAAPAGAAMGQGRYQALEQLEQPVATSP